MSFKFRGVIAVVIAMALPVGVTDLHPGPAPTIHVPKPPPGFWAAIAHWLEGGGAKKIAHSLSDGKYAEQVVAAFAKSKKFKAEVKNLHADEILFDDDPLCSEGFHPSESSLDNLATYFQNDSSEEDSRGWVPIQQKATKIHGQIERWITANLNKKYPTVKEKKAVLVNVNHFRELFCHGHDVVKALK
jgi:hypothetical protein